MNKKVSFSEEKLSCFPQGIRKKGISAVVATVLIILITVAAVTIIWAAIIPMIKEQTVGGTTCLDAVSQVGIGSEGGYTCVNTATGSAPDGKGNLSLQLSRGAADFDLAGVQIIVSIGGDTYSNESINIGLDANEQVILQLISSRFTGTINVSQADKVEIAPIVSIGNTQKTCDVAASASLSAC